MSESAPERVPSETRPPSFSRIAYMVWPLAILSFGYHLVQASGSQNGVGQGYDTKWDWRAAHAFLHGGTIYNSVGIVHYVHPPSTLVLLAPLGLVDFGPARAMIFVAQTAGIVISALLMLKLFDRDWRGSAGAFLVLGISLAEPFLYALNAGNVNGIVLLGETAMLLAAARSKWVLAGIAFGLSLAVKPVIAPVIIVFALYRKWRAGAVALAIPLVLSGIALLSSPQTHAFFHTALPQLLKGQTDYAQSFSVSLSSGAARLGLPHVAGVAIRLISLAVVAALVWRRWKIPTDRVRKLVELVGILVLGTLLTAPLTLTYYGVYLLPLALWATGLASRVNLCIAWTGIYCVAASDVWQSSRLPAFANKLASLRPTLGYLLLLAVLWRAVTTERSARAAASVG